jgi:plastocyanin
MLRRYFYVVCTAALLVAILAGRQTTHASAPAAPSMAGGAEVKIDNFTFAPASLTVAVGTTVTWTNRDDIPHTVVSDDQSIKSKALDTDDKFTFTFTKPGTYSYFCSLHPKMKGTVIVQ